MSSVPSAEPRAACVLARRGVYFLNHLLCPVRLQVSLGYKDVHVCALSAWQTPHDCLLNKVYLELHLSHYVDGS